MKPEGDYNCIICDYEIVRLFRFEVSESDYILIVLTTSVQMSLIVGLIMKQLTDWQKCVYLSMILIRVACWNLNPKWVQVEFSMIVFVTLYVKYDLHLFPPFLGLTCCEKVY